MTRPSFETWLKDTECVAIVDKTVFIQTPNTFVAQMLEERMYSLIRSVLSEVIGYDVQAQFVVVASEDSQPEAVSPS